MPWYHAEKDWDSPCPHGVLSLYVYINTHTNRHPCKLSALILWSVGWGWGFPSHSWTRKGGLIHGRLHSWYLGRNTSVGKEIGNTSVREREELRELSEQVYRENQFGKLKAPCGCSSVRDEGGGQGRGRSRQKPSTSCPGHWEEWNPTGCTAGTGVSIGAFGQLQMGICHPPWQGLGLPWWLRQ